MAEGLLGRDAGTQQHLHWRRAAGLVGVQTWQHSRSFQPGDCRPASLVRFCRHLRNMQGCGAWSSWQRQRVEVVSFYSLFKPVMKILGGF